MNTKSITYLAQIETTFETETRKALAALAPATDAAPYDPVAILFECIFEGDDQIEHHLISSIGDRHEFVSDGPFCVSEERRAHAALAQVLVQDDEAFRLFVQDHVAPLVSHLDDVPVAACVSADGVIVDNVFALSQKGKSTDDDGIQVFLSDLVSLEDRDQACGRLQRLLQLMLKSSEEASRSEETRLGEMDNAPRVTLPQPPYGKKAA